MIHIFVGDDSIKLAHMIFFFFLDHGGGLPGGGLIALGQIFGRTHFYSSHQTKMSLHQHALLQRARFGSGNFGSSLSYVRTHQCRSVEWPRNRIARPASAWEGVLENFLYRVCLRFEQKFCLFVICSKFEQIINSV